jgi:hypothetical protein
VGNSPRGPELAFPLGGAQNQRTETNITPLRLLAWLRYWLLVLRLEGVLLGNKPAYDTPRQPFMAQYTAPQQQQPRQQRHLRTHTHTATTQCPVSRDRDTHSALPSPQEATSIQLPEADSERG